MLPKPKQESSEKPSLAESTVITFNPNIAAALGPFGVGIMPNLTREISNGNEYRNGSSYMVTRVGRSALYGNTVSRKLIDAYENGSLWNTDPLHPFLFAMAALESLPAVRDHIKGGHKIKTEQEMPGTSPVCVATLGSATDTPLVVSDDEIMRTDSIPIILSAISCGATLFPELTSPSASGLAWIHFSRHVPAFEPGAVGTADLKRGFERPLDFPRLAAGLAAAKAKAELARWERDGEIWLFRDKPHRGQIRMLGDKKVDGRHHAYIRKRACNDATLDMVKKHLSK